MSFPEPRRTLPHLDPDNRVVDASAYFPGYKSQAERISDFYKIIHDYHKEDTPIDPKLSRELVGKHTICHSIQARQTADLLTVFTANSVHITDNLRLEAKSGVKTFILSVLKMNPSGDINYVMFTPNPDPDDPRIARVLRASGIDSKPYYLLTLGLGPNALADESTKTEIEEAIKQSGVTPDDLIRSRAVEVSYVIFDNGDQTDPQNARYYSDDEDSEGTDRRLTFVKFVTLPKDLLGARDLKLRDGVIFDISPTADALSVIGDLDSGNITFALDAIIYEIKSVANFTSPTSTLA